MNAPTRTVHDATVITPAKQLESSIKSSIDKALRHYERCTNICRNELKMDHEAGTHYQLARSTDRPSEHAMNWMFDRIGIKLTSINGFLSARQAVPSSIALGSEPRSEEDARSRAKWAHTFIHDLTTSDLLHEGQPIPLFDALINHINTAPIKAQELGDNDISALRAQAIKEATGLKQAIDEITHDLGKMENYYQAHPIMKAATSSTDKGRS